MLSLSISLSLWQCPNSCPPGRSGYPGLPGMRVREQFPYFIFKSIIHRKNRAFPVSTGLPGERPHSDGLGKSVFACSAA